MDTAEILSDKEGKDEIPPESQTDEEILAEARKRYMLCVDAMSENRIAALDDLKFKAGDQWPEEAKIARSRPGQERPMITVNSLPTYLHQVTNDLRQNTPAIKVHPVGEGADIETAKVVQGLIRHIEYDSNADISYDRSVDSAASIGFGYWRLVTDYEDDDSFDQKIMYKSIRNALSVKIDPLSAEPDGSDMQYAFIEFQMDRSEFKSEYPDAKASGQTSYTDGSTSAFNGWLSENSVLVMDYYRIERTEDEYLLLSNGEKGWKSQLLEMPPGITIAKTRKSWRCKTMLYKITAVDILERTEIKCKWIPVFPVYGDEIDIEGKIIRSGIIRNAKGPSQMYNYFMTAATEEVALRPKTPYIMAEGQDESYEDMWASANNVMYSALVYKPKTLEGNLVPPPQRQPMADIPSGMLALSGHAADNVKKTTGLFDASLGARGSATSGKQEIAQQKEGDMANFHYSDGLIRTVRHCARCLVDMIPSYYDSERVVRILGEDDAASTAVINKQLPVGVVDPETNAVKTVLNDLTVGKYDVTVSSGPSYSTMRQESAEFFTGAMQAAKDPATSAVVTYLAMKNQDVPGGEEATKMLKKLLPPGVAEPEKGEEQKPQMIPTPRGPIPVTQAPQVIQALELHAKDLEDKLAKIDQAKQQLDLLKQQEVLAAQQLEPQKQQIAMAQAEGARIKAQADLVAAEADLVRARAEAEVMPQKTALEVDTAHINRAAAETKHADAIRAAHEAVAEANKPPEEPEPTLQDMVKLIEAGRPKVPTGMKITSPEGRVYDVVLH